VLERVRDVLRPGGRLLLMEAFSLPLTILHPRRPVARWAPGAARTSYSWWIPNLSCLRWWGRCVGFEAQPWTRQVHRPRTTTGKVLPLTIVELRRL
jgi:hypothetical protein